MESSLCERGQEIVFEVSIDIDAWISVVEELPWAAQSDFES